MKEQKPDKEGMRNGKVPECLMTSCGKREGPDESKIRGIYRTYSTPFRDLFVREAKRSDAEEEARKQMP